MGQLVNYYGFGHSSNQDTHNSVMSLSELVLGAMHDMGGGDYYSRAFATYILESVFDMFGHDVAYHNAVKRLHKVFEEDVKNRLAPGMTDDEAALYMLKNALVSHGYNDLWALINGDFFIKKNIPV